MELQENVGGTDRLARAALAVVLTIAAVRSLRRGKRVRGLLVGIGALAFGFNATTKYCGVNDALSIDTTDDGVSVEIDDLETETADDEATTAAAATTSGDTRGLTCAACGEPIRTGQRRGPNADDEIVHEDCQ